MHVKRYALLFTLLLLTRCASSVKQCTANKCQHNGNCSNVPNGDYYCECPSTHIGKNCQIPAPTQCDPKPCLNGGTCEDSSDDGTFNCTCPPGYRGQICEVETCNSTSACGPGDGTRHGKCVNNVWQDSGKATIVGHSCFCDEGWSGDECLSDIDECQSLGICGTGTCLNLQGNFTCNCDGTGYSGAKCQEKHICHDDTSPCDKEHSISCNPGSTSNDYTCTCKPGYNGDNCSEAINYCRSSPCNNGNCTNKPDEQKYECECHKGYDGTNCSLNIDECASNPCKNGGTCNDEVDGYNCACTPAWDGTNCERNVDECDLASGKDVCNVKDYNSSNSCNDKSGGFECVCDNASWVGARCFIKNSCNETTCKNSGICKPVLDTVVNNQSGFECNCSEGYTGPLCEKVLPAVATSDSELTIIIAVCVTLALLCLIVAIVIFFKSAKSKRANRGTYSPSNQECIGSRVEMGNILKPPPEERLI